MGSVPEGFPGESQRCPTCGGLVLIDNETHKGFRRIRWRCPNCNNGGFMVV